MYQHSRVVENANDVFISGLALLNSSETDSAEKLRRMLSDLIENKLVIANDREKRRSKLTKSSSNIRKTESSMIHENHVESIDENHREDRRFCLESKKHIDVDGEIDDFSENIDVPRISIPDENSDDGKTVCKICKGGKLGPLILLECQECQEAYHPLCHQPAVVEIDVYDPRLVWRCGNCLEINDTTEEVFHNYPLVVTVEDDESDDDEGGGGGDDDDDDQQGETENFVSDVFRNVKTRKALEKIDDRGAAKNKKILGAGRTRPSVEMSSCGRAMKNSSVQLKKKQRVGSKLNLIRLSPS